MISPSVRAIFYTYTFSLRILKDSAYFFFGVPYIAYIM